MHLHLTDALVGLFVLGMIYRRLRGSVGFQPLMPLRLWMRSAFFAAFCGLILCLDAEHPAAIAVDLGGGACGLGAALFAMRATALRRQNGAWYYRPHPWIGFLLTVLFVWRLADRLLPAVYTTPAPSGAVAALVPHFNLQAYSRDLWTAAVYFLLAAYSVTTALLVLRAARQAERTESAAADARSATVPLSAASGPIP